MSEKENNNFKDVVILDNTRLQGEELKLAIATLEKLLKCTNEHAKNVLTVKGAKTIGTGLNPEYANKILGVLRTAGIICDSRPTKLTEGSGLSLVEKPPEYKECPKCKHKHLLVAGKPEPTSCDNIQCKVIFEAYEKHLIRLKEKAKMEARLKGEADAKKAAEAKQREEEEKKDRRLRMENEIRAKLGLPTLINTRGRLISSALVINLLGIVIGVALVSVYNLSTGTNLGSANSLQHYNVTLGAVHTLPSVSKNPGMMAQTAINQMLASQSSTSDSDIPIGPPGDFDPKSLPMPPVIPEPASALDVNIDTGYRGNESQFLNTKLTNIKTDTEWDQHLLTQTNAEAAKGDTTAAAKLLDQVREPQQRFTHGARLVGQLLDQNRKAEADGIYRNLSNSGEKLTGGPTVRIESLCTLARQQHAAGRKAEVETLLQKVRTIADTIIEPADKVVANSEIAALLTIMGRAEDARSLFTAAIKNLEDVPDPVRQLTTIARIAPGYAKAGYRASALNLLENAIRKSSTLEDAKARSQTLGKLAEVCAQLADMQTATTALQSIPYLIDRDETLYHIVTQSVLSERIAQAIDMAKYIRTPTYQALAFGFLGLTQQQQANYQGLAATYKARARRAVDSIESVAEKSAVMSELGRFAARSGDTTQAKLYFTDSKQLAESLATIPEKDRALAILAANKAQALMFTEAQQDLALVTDANIRYSVGADIANWQQTAKIGL